MDKIKLTLTREGAQSLRDFADALLRSAENIEEATNTLSTVFSENSQDLGVHLSDFEEMLEHIKAAKQKGQDAITALAPKMRYAAETIDAYVDTLPTSVVGGSVDRSMAKESTYSSDGVVGGRASKRESKEEPI